MTQEQITNFYAEMAAVCAKYGVEGMAGMWFSGNSDDYGFFHGYYTGPETATGRVCRLISEKLEGWADNIHKGPQKGYTTAFGIKPPNG